VFVCVRECTSMCVCVVVYVHVCAYVYVCVYISNQDCNECNISGATQDSLAARPFLVAPQRC